MANLDYLFSMERQWAEQSDRLEDLHMEAAIDAALTHVVLDENDDDDEDDNHNDDMVSVDDTTISSKKKKKKKKTTKTVPIFDDYVNDHAVCNCFSPYVPTPATCITGLISLVNIQSNDVLLDIGCGDGRVGILTVKLTNCTFIGCDVSPLCIAAARKNMMDVLHVRDPMVLPSCTFYQMDATQSLSHLQQINNDFFQAIHQVTVIYLYTYPTLLQQLLPMLRYLFHREGSMLRTVVTLTYHLRSSQGQILKHDKVHDLTSYSDIFLDEVTS
jgi:SAM-dependent methyltransferase